MVDDTKIDYIAQKVDIVSEKVSDINVKLEVHMAKFDAIVDDIGIDRAQLTRNTDILGTNTHSLQEHMKRTEILENYVRNIEGRFTPVELEAMRKKAVSEWIKGKLVLTVKFGGAVAALGSLGTAIKFMLQYLFQH